jgi:hypothetical protein
MMEAIVDAMAAFLSAAPDPLLAAARIADRVPSSAGDLPAIALSVAVESSRGTGLGRFRREGNQLVRNSAIVEIAPSAGGFSADLKMLQLTPLPLRKPAEVQVTRLTGANQPGPYRAVDSPAAVNEFMVDSIRARVIFGAAQPAGEKLEVNHWSIDFRNDITGGRSQGALTFDVWGGSAADTAALARKLQAKLEDESALRPHGFAALRPVILNPAENVAYQPGVGSAFAAWKQRLTYQFHFDVEQGGEASSGGPIKKINVDMDGELNEPFPVPASS